MLLLDLARASAEVTGATGRKAKAAILARLLGDADDRALPLAARMLAGELPDGKVGIGPALLHEVRGTPPAVEASLTVVDLRDRLAEIGAIAGAGSKARRRDALIAVWASATAVEQGFLGRLLFGELRQGAQDGVILDAIAEATRTPPKAVRRAAMLSGDLGATALAARTGGRAALDAFRLHLFRPLSPMLASPCDSVEDALAELGGPVRLELKLDGARIQVHRDRDRVRIWSRQMNDVTAALPEVVEAVAGLPCATIVLDGEAICLRPDGRPMPFQETMKRFLATSRRDGSGTVDRSQPIRPFFFDVLHLDGVDLLDAPLSERAAALERIVPEPLRVDARTPDSVDAATAFLDAAIAAGHEGLIAKDPGAPWAAGSRGKAWLKLKPAHTLDLVVLAAEWGSGRRRGWLSNLHLGARDPDGGFAMLGKTFKGLTDEMLAWQTSELLKRETRRTEWVVSVRPELVVEVAFNEVQQSPRYPAGLALRFARVKRYRPDKSVLDVDTVDTVRDIFERHRA